LTLETGASDAVVNYTSGSGSSVLTFTYTIAAGQNSLTSTMSPATALTLNGGSIQNASATDAVLTLPGAGRRRLARRQPRPSSSTRRRRP